MLINIGVYIITVVISANNIFKCDVFKFCSTSLKLFYNKFIEPDLRLVKE